MSDQAIDLQATLNDRYENLLNKQKNCTWTDWDFIGVWDIYSSIILARLEYYISNSPYSSIGYSKDEAIIYGHLARIFDLLRSIRRSVLKETATREIISIMNRSIIETCITLEYFLTFYDDKLLDDYRMTSLKMLRSYENVVKKNIDLRNGDKIAIEDSILKSISKAYENSGVSRDDIDKWNAKKSILKGFKDRFKDVGKEDLYDVAYRTGSQSTHGNWDTLTTNYLIYNIDTERFSIDLREIPLDFREINPILIIIVNTLKVYLSLYERNEANLKDIEFFEELLACLADLEELHEKYLGR
jgi:hypothetical protein